MNEFGQYAVHTYILWSAYSFLLNPSWLDATNVLDHDHYYEKHGY